MKNENETDVIVRLPIRARRTEYGEGEVATAHTVPCPLRKGSVPLAQCADCHRYTGASLPAEGPAAMWCVVPDAVARPDEPADPTNLVEWMQKTPITQLVDTTVTCLDTELSVEEAAQLLDARGASAAPVVEDGGVLLGVVSRIDCTRDGPILCGMNEDDEDRGLRYPMSHDHRIVEDVMSTESPRIHEWATVADAVSLFSQHQVGLLPVVSRQDEVVGTLRLMDVMRWIAARLDSK